MRTILLVIGLLTLQATAIDCHYTCQTCNSTTYNSCITCPDGQPLAYQLTNAPNAQGVCGKITTNNANAVGIIVLIVSVSAGAIIFNEEVIYLILFLQSIGLVYLVEVYWLPILDYVLSGLTYLMFFTKVAYSYKDSPPTGVDPQICKGRLFFKQFQLPSNFLTVGLADLVLFVLIVFLVVFKYCRKSCLKERAQILPDWLLDKLVLIFSTAFLMLVQQSIAVIFFSLKYGTTEGSSIALIVFYFIALALFILNHYSFPLPYFRNKFAQINTILGKILVPGFLLGSSSSSFLAFLFMIITWVVDLIATNKNRNPNDLNRLLGYKILNLLCLMFLTIYYMIDILANSQAVSRGIGVVCAIILFGCLQLFGLQIFIAAKKSTCMQEPFKTEKKEVQKPQIKQKEDLTLENIRIEQRQNHPNNVLQRINFDFETSSLRRQPPTSVPYTYEQHNNQQLVESKREEEGRPSLSSERQSSEVIQQPEVKSQCIVVRQQLNYDQENQNQGYKDITSEVLLVQNKLTNQRQDGNEDGQQLDNREITESNVPMKKQPRKKHRKNKKNLNALQQ